MTNLTEISRQYPHNESHMRQYVEYQLKYAVQIRESDKIIIESVGKYVGGQPGAKVLDIGCSTGNLLKHLRRCYPDLDLVGGDLSELEISNCKANSDLAGIHFEVMDITSISSTAMYDLVIANAVLFALEDDDFSSAILNIANSLKAGGTLLAFDWFHPWRQELTILEKSGNIPQGLVLHSRSYENVRGNLGINGFDAIEFVPFAIPIDLPRPPYDTPRLETYTVNTADGDRLQFRGVIAQPWTHLTARRK